MNRARYPSDSDQEYGQQQQQQDDEDDHHQRLSLVDHMEGASPSRVRRNPRLRRLWGISSFGSRSNDDDDHDDRPAEKDALLQDPDSRSPVSAQRDRRRRRQASWTASDYDEDGDELEENEQDRLGQSEPILGFYRADDDDDDNDESEDDDNEKNDGSEESSSSREIPQDSESRPRRPRFTYRSFSSFSLGSYRDNESDTNTGYRDKESNQDDDDDDDNHFHVQGRIQGFGSPAPTTANTTRRNSSLRERLAHNFRQGMKRMSIGTEEDSAVLRSPLERVVVGLGVHPFADSGMYAPQLDGYTSAAATDEETSMPAPPPSFRRRTLGDVDDANYILFLECELQNKELEVDSWKRRVRELEQQLQQVDDDGTDSSDQDDDEVEWQTGSQHVQEEEVLIDIDNDDDGSTKNRNVKQACNEAEDNDEDEDDSASHSVNPIDTVAPMAEKCLIDLTQDAALDLLDGPAVVSDDEQSPRSASREPDEDLLGLESLVTVGN